MALLGDGKSGKTALTTQVAINQKNTDLTVICVLISKRQRDVAQLVDRLEKLDLVQRSADPADGRRALIRLTETGEARLRELSSIHVEELRSIGPALAAMLAPLA